MPIPTLVRRQLRLAAKAALDAANQAPNVNLGATIFSPGDWNTAIEDLPAILLRTPDDRKESVQKGQPEFTTTVTLEIEGRLKADTAEDAQDQIEVLCAKVELVLFGNYDLMRLVQQIAFVGTKTEITAEGRDHLAGFRMHLGLEVFEAFDPFELAQPEALTEIGVHVDLAAPFDANGTYANPPFPDAVSPAPRTSGPDGRDEGYLDIQLPQ